MCRRRSAEQGDSGAEAACVVVKGWLQTAQVLALEFCICSGACQAGEATNSSVVLILLLCVAVHDPGQSARACLLEGTVCCAVLW